MIRRFQSRKFALAAFLLVIALPALLWTGKLDAAEFVDSLKWVFGLYCTGNVLAKLPAQTGGEATSV